MTLVEWLVSSYKWSMDEISGEHKRRGLFKILDLFFFGCALIWLMSMAIAFSTVGGCHDE